MPALTNKRSVDLLAQRVSEYVSVCQKIGDLEIQRKDLRDVLVRKGPGELAGANGERVKVVHPMAKICPPAADKIDVIRERIGEENFKTLFERVWKPVKDFRSVLVRVCTRAQQRNVLAFTEVDCAPYVTIL